MTNMIRLTLASVYQPIITSVFTISSSTGENFGIPHLTIREFSNGSVMELNPVAYKDFLKNPFQVLGLSPVYEYEDRTLRTTMMVQTVTILELEDDFVIEHTRHLVEED